MAKKMPEASALFVRLPANAAEKLHRAAEAMGLRKKDIVANLVTKHLGEPTQAMGSYSFRPYEPADSRSEPPDVMDPAQAAQFLQIDAAMVIELAEAGKLPGRKLGKEWRFARAGLVAWLSGSEKR